MLIMLVVCVCVCWDRSHSWSFMEEFDYLHENKYSITRLCNKEVRKTKHSRPQTPAFSGRLIDIMTWCLTKQSIYPSMHSRSWYFCGWPLLYHCYCELHSMVFFVFAYLSEKKKKKCQRFCGPANNWPSQRLAICLQQFEGHHLFIHISAMCVAPSLFEAAAQLYSLNSYLLCPLQSSPIIRVHIQNNKPIANHCFNHNNNFTILSVQFSKSSFAPRQWWRWLNAFCVRSSLCVYLLEQHFFFL